MGNRPKHPKKPPVPLSDMLFATATGSLATEHWHPSMDLCENDEAVLIRLEIPGVDRHDIRIRFQGGILKVEGIKREPEFPEDEHLRFICMERGYGPFQKILECQWVIDPRHASAVLRDGVLTITLPKFINRRGAVFDIPVTTPADE